MHHYKNSNTDETVAQLPKVWNYQGKAIMGITEGNMASFGWIKVELPDPVPVGPVISDALAAKEADVTLVECWVGLKDRLLGVL